MSLLFTAATSAHAFDPTKDRETHLLSRSMFGGFPNGPSGNPKFSKDGQGAKLAAFESDASDLVPGDTNGKTDVFIVRRGGHFTTDKGEPWQPAGRAQLVSVGLHGTRRLGRGRSLPRMQRIGLVVHPSREIGRPLATLREWAERRGIEVVQLRARDAMRRVAPLGEVSMCDLVVAIGGDGTVLTALRAAATTSTPVLGVACGSLGALSAVMAGDLEDALDRFAAGSWSRRELRKLHVEVEGETVVWAFNDIVLVRRSPGQLIVEVSVDGELYARMAGDGVIVATPLGSSAYSMASGGPVLVEAAKAFVVTPLAIHGGCAPPLVVREGSEVTLVAHPGYGGFEVEVDGQAQTIDATHFAVTLAESTATLVAVAQPGLGLTALRQRGLIADSPRVLARDERAQVAQPAQTD